MTSTDRASQLVGSTLAERYRLTGVAMEGPTGAIFVAEHVHMRHRVVVKVLYPDAAERHELLVRFEREALAGAHVEHDNVAAATDYGAQPDGLRFLVLEYLEGPSLRDVLAAGPLEVRRALHIGTQIARALASMHGRGIVHRGLSPEAVLLVSRGGEHDIVKVMDFGSALLPASLVENEADVRRQTRIATPLRPTGAQTAFAAPEIIAGHSETVDGRADIYSLGVVLFQMLVGAPPPPGAQALPSVKPVRPDAPAEIDALLGRMLTADPVARAPDALALAEEMTDLATSMQVAFSSAATSYGGLAAAQTHLPVKSQGMSSWVPPAPKIESRPRYPIPLPIHLASGGAALATLLIVLIAAGRETPFRGVERARGDLLTIGGSEDVGSHTLAGTGDGDEDDDDDDDDGDREAGTDSSGGPSISLAIPGVEGPPPLTTSESREAYQALTHQFRVGNLKGAVSALENLIKVDPRAPEEGEVREKIMDLAVRVMFVQGDYPDRVFALLENHMGTEGIDILYSLMTTRGGSKAAKRAERTLTQPALRKRGSEAFQIAYDLRAAKACDDKKALFPRAIEHGDRRAYGELVLINCSRRGYSNCCMHEDDGLKAALKALEAKGFR